MMLISCTAVLLFCMVSSKLSLALRNGAPSHSCYYMLPGHTTGPGLHDDPLTEKEPETSRYTINATWEENYRYVRLTITGSEFKGFLIQARQSVDGDPIGSFTIDDEMSNVTMYQSCTDKHHNQYDSRASITHMDPSVKNNVSVLWQPPRDASGNVTFYATIVKSFRVFWFKLPSNTLNLSDKSRGSSLSVALFSNLVVLIVTLMLKSVTF